MDLLISPSNSAKTMIQVLSRLGPTITSTLRVEAGQKVEMTPQTGRVNHLRVRWLPKTTTTNRTKNKVKASTKESLMKSYRLLNQLTTIIK